MPREDHDLATMLGDRGSCGAAVIAAPPAGGLRWLCGCWTFAPGDTRWP